MYYIDLIYATIKSAKNQKNYDNKWKVMAESSSAMPMTRSVVQQQLVSLPSGLSEASSKFADDMWSNPRVSFAPTSVRGSTLVSSQGDHATAYALYWEYMRIATARNTDDGELHVSPFSNGVYYRLQQDKQALETCNLIIQPQLLLRETEALKLKIVGNTGSKTKEPAYSDDPILKIDEFLEFCQRVLANYRKKENKGALTIYNSLNIALRKLILQKKLLDHLEEWETNFKSLLERTQSLQATYNAQMDKLRDRRNVHRRILASADSLRIKLEKKESVPSAIDDEFRALLSEIRQLKGLDSELSEDKRRLKAEYFCTVIRSWAENFLLYQNQMPFVTFQRIPDLAAGSDEGSIVSAALASLRSFNDSEAEINPRQFREILEHIDSLLFIPKLRDEVLDDQQSQREEILSNNRKNVLQYIFIRDNDLNVFSYIIARHLQTVFNAFPILFEQPKLKEYIIQEFLKRRFNDWDLNARQKSYCEAKIHQILAIYATTAASLLELSVTSPFSTPASRRIAHAATPASPFDRQADAEQHEMSGFSPMTPMFRQKREEQEEEEKLRHLAATKATEKGKPASKEDERSKKDKPDA